MLAIHVNISVHTISDNMDGFKCELTAIIVRTSFFVNILESIYLFLFWLLLSFFHALLSNHCAQLQDGLVQRVLDALQLVSRKPLQTIFLILCSVCCNFVYMHLLTLKCFVVVFV